METWKILLITLLSAIVLGCILGVVIGKHQVKKASASFKPLLSLKERVIYLLCVAAGTGCVLFGIFYNFPAPVPDMAGDETGGFDEDGVLAFDGEGVEAGIVFDNIDPDGIAIDGSLDEGETTEAAGDAADEEDLSESGGTDTAAFSPAPSVQPRIVTGAADKAFIVQAR